MVLVKQVVKHLVIFLVTFASLVTLFSYFGNYDPPVSFVRAEMQKGPIYPGQVVYIQWEVERTRRCYVEFDRELYADTDGENIRIPLLNDVREGGLPITQHERFKTKIRLPKDMKPGKAMYRSTGLYSCNLFQRLKPILVPAPEVDFVVLAPEPVTP